MEKGKKDFARDRMAFSGSGRGISRLLQSLKRNYCKLTANEDWRGGESIRILRSPIGGSGRFHCDTTKILWSPSPKPFSSPSCRVALLFRCFGNLKKNQKQQEAKSEKQQAVAQFFNFSAEIPPFGKHWMADDRSEDLNTEELTF